jgi:hypothetical protein
MSLPPARYRTAAIMAGLVCCAVLARLPFLSNVGVDEAYYLVVGRQWLEGTPPYAGAFDVKPPLLFALMAGAEAVFGPALLAAKALSMAAVAATACGLYLFGRRFTGELSGLAAALFYIAASLNLGGAFSPAELSMAPFTTFGALLGLAAALSPRPRPMLLFAAGLLFGAAASVKQTALFEALALVLYLGANPSRPRQIVERRTPSPQPSPPGRGSPVATVATPFPLPGGEGQGEGRVARRETTPLAWFGAGLCAVPAGFAVYFFAHGHLDALLADAVLAAIGRAGAQYVPWSDAALRFLIELLLVLPLVIMAAPVLACKSAFRGEPVYPALNFLAIWAAAALAAVVATRAALVIYFLPVLPPLCIASGFCLQQALARLPARKRFTIALPAAVAAVGAYSLITLAPLLFAGRENLASAADASAAMKSAGLAANDRILVADRDLIVYLASGSNPPGRVFHPLQLFCGFAGQGDGAALADSLRSRPAFIVVAEPFHTRGCEEPGRRLLLNETLQRDYCAFGRFGNALTGDKGGPLVVYGLKERVAPRCT